jgi:hypothetical protein
MVPSERNDDRRCGLLPGAPFDYSVRPLRPLDLDGISRVHWRACRIAYRFMSWSYSEDEVRRWYAGKLEAWDWGQVVCAGDGVVGYLAAAGAHIDQLCSTSSNRAAGRGHVLGRGGATTAPAGPARRIARVCIVMVSDVARLRS